MTPPKTKTSPQLKMNKSAQTSTPIHPLLAERYSPRTFDTRPISANALISLFEAARWAPSSRNLQPWSFIVAVRQNEAEFAALLACLKAGNQRWAQHAAVLMLAVAHMRDTADSEPNYKKYYDLGLAVANLTTEAMAHDIYIRQMGGFLPDVARSTYAIPATHTPVVGLALGYRGSVTDLPEDLQTREQQPRSRNPLTSFVFSGLWGQPWPGLTNAKNSPL